MGGRLPLGHREVPYVLADGRLQLSLSVGVPRNDLRKCLPPPPPLLNPIGAVGVATGALLPLLPAPLSLCPYLLPLLFLIPSMVYRQKKDHDASQKGRLSHSDHVGRKRTRLLDDNNMLQNASKCFKMLQTASKCFNTPWRSCPGLACAIDRIRTTVATISFQI